MHHKLFRQGVNMESQWIIWLLASINAVCVTNVFLRLVQDRADKPMVRSMLCLQTWTLLWPAVPHWLSLLTVILFQNKLALSGRAIFSPGRGCHPVQHIFFPSPAASDCCRNVVIADGLGISENQQHLCHFHPLTLGYHFSFKWFGFFLANEYDLLHFFKY